MSEDASIPIPINTGYLGEAADWLKRFVLLRNVRGLLLVLVELENCKFNTWNNPVAK